MHKLSILKRPLVTEKSTLLQEGSRYVFEVDRRATKLQVKEAIETAFSVKVKKVNTINMPGKEKRYGMNIVPKKPWKKAIVILQSGQSIEIFEGV
tara:strand:- start:580 stop:864 length:285 start_codon:yes stop_codon:yes gene_type:complete